MLNTVQHGDCRYLLFKLHASPKMIFADPPFNIGQNYRGFDDNMTHEEYVKFTKQWINECWLILKDGVLIIHGNDYVARTVIKMEDELGLVPLSWNFLTFNFGVCIRTNWINAHSHCLIYKKGDYTWNPENVLIESARVKYKDKRVTQTKNGGTRVPGTVWGFDDVPYLSRVSGTNAERWNPHIHPNQLPQTYLKRLILAYTNPGDLVIDPFAGSGTTALVSKSLGRNFITMDVSKEVCQSVEERLEGGFVR